MDISYAGIEAGLRKESRFVDLENEGIFEGVSARSGDRCHLRCLLPSKEGWHDHTGRGDGTGIRQLDAGTLRATAFLAMYCGTAPTASGTSYAICTE